MSSQSSHIDEKDIEKGRESTHTVEETQDWTKAEERRVVWKLDVSVLLLLFFGFFCFQLERG
jgi:hypothetical protein